MTKEWRKTAQNLLPVKKKPLTNDTYDIYPSFNIGEGKIFQGFESLAEAIAGCKRVIIDGYQGVFFDSIRKSLDDCLQKKGIKSVWIDTGAFLKPEKELDLLLAPFTGGNDPLFGRKTGLDLADFFDFPVIQPAITDDNSAMVVVTGIGASLFLDEGLLIYADMPKNELQFRARAGSITNLGSACPSDPKTMYKRSYFVDWVVLNRHKEKILPGIDIFIDSQRNDDPVWIIGDNLRDALSALSRNFFRVRPWFEPGPWGGDWIKDHIKGLNNEVPNYAWSFELIVPENGLLLESSSLLLEASFDCLMFREAKAVLGDCYERFGNEFPIRFDFLDTFNGGNLSIQCHPRPEYIREHFGESFTQEETYYILDTRDDAVVYLGFTEEAEPGEFSRALRKSFLEKSPFDAERYVMKMPSSKHDLFLIPYGTIHGSGRNNLVLEISSTPYIFTFKMYDWLRKDLEGKLRELNIDRAMDNLYFDRRGGYVSQKLKSKPVLLEKGEDWELWHLPTHETHMYDVHRYRFYTSVEIRTENKCLVMNLVEGQKIRLETEKGLKQEFRYAETFVIPAAAGKIRITNLSHGYAMLVKAFIK